MVLTNPRVPGSMGSMAVYGSSESRENLETEKERAKEENSDGVSRTKKLVSPLSHFVLTLDHPRRHAEVALRLTKSIDRGPEFDWGFANLESIILKHTQCQLEADKLIG
jgi:hypothetical protein